MRCMKVDDKYRIIRDGDHLPEEISQKEMDKALSDLKKAVMHVSTILSDIHARCDVINSIVTEIMNNSCLDYIFGEEWHLKQLVNEIESVQEQIHEGSDVVPSYEEAETIEDAGFRESWHNSEIFEKVLEDTEEREVVEEIVLKYDPPLYRKRTTIWEPIKGGRHSKEIKYEDLPLNERIERLIRNTKREKTGKH